MYSMCWMSSISRSERHKTLSRTPSTACVGVTWGTFQNFGHVFYLISAANQSSGATRVALFSVPGRHQSIASKLIAKSQIQSIATILFATSPFHV